MYHKIKCFVSRKVRSMPSFILPLNEINKKIVDFYEGCDRVEAKKRDGRIFVYFNGGLTILRMEVDAAAGSITDKEWRDLIRDIKKTLKGAKIRGFSDIDIRIYPLRTEYAHLRLDPLEKELILDAAKTEHRSLSDFVRMAALEKADQVLIKKSMIKERVEATKKQAKETEIYG